MLLGVRHFRRGVEEQSVQQDEREYPGYRRSISGRLFEEIDDVPRLRDRRGHDALHLVVPDVPGVFDLVRVALGLDGAVVQAHDPVGGDIV